VAHGVGAGNDWVSKTPISVGNSPGISTLDRSSRGSLREKASAVTRLAASGPDLSSMCCAIASTRRGTLSASPFSVIGSARR
jgi:hypothetical protein